MYSFANEIKKIRQSKKMTLEEMADSLNTLAEELNANGVEEYPNSINKGLISRWENGKTEPRMDTVRLLSKWSGVSVDTLLGIDSDNEKKPSQNQMIVAAHIDDDATKEEVEKILEFIDLMKMKYGDTRKN